MASAESSSLPSLLSSGLQEMSLALSDAQQQKLLDYVALLARWNKVYNLTAIREPDRMIGLHILDSLAIVPHLGNARSLLDVGTGAGLPGICIAIACPALNVVMLDSLQKKTTFVRQAIGELGLPNASVVCERVEKFRPPAPFEIVTSRAFAELADLVHGAAHLVATDGKMLAMKGLVPEAEIARLPASHHVTAIVELMVPQVDGQRHLITLEAR